MLGGIWPFLKDHDNLAVLGSIGAGIAAIAGGAWAVFTFFAKKSEKEPALAAIAEEVQALIAKGEFDDARRALARGREASRTLRIDASRYEAAFLAQEARVDDLQLAYRSAAAKYAEAASLVAPFHKEQQWRFLLAQAGELFKQGDEFGDNAALTEAIDVYHRCPRSRAAFGKTARLGRNPNQPRHCAL
jgi:hypothetical protein